MYRTTNRRRFLIDATSLAVSAYLFPKVARGQDTNRTRIILLGTKGGPTLGTSGRSNPSTLLLINNVPYVIDCGYGVSRQLIKAGVALDTRGFVQVNERLETTASGVWAIGECAGSPQFTHVSVDDFRIVRDNMAGGHRRTDDRLVPHVMFTDPPLARVGLSEAEAKRQGIPVRVAKLPMRKVLRTLATDETAGFMKALVGAKDDRILGFTMIGSEAGEVMAVIQAAMLAELPYTKLRDAVIAHLTVAEGLGPLFEGVPARPV